jgi:hypothetical protein
MERPGHAVLSVSRERIRMIDELGLAPAVLDKLYRTHAERLLKLQ